MKKLFFEVLVSYVISSYVFFSFVQLDPLPFLAWNWLGRAFYAVLLVVISFVTAAAVCERKK